MLDEIRAELAAAERRSIERFERFATAMLHLAEHAIHQRNTDMSKATDAIKADLVTLEATVDAAVAHATDVAADAVAAEEADLADIRTHIETISGKVEGMVPTVAAAAAPAALTSAAAPVSTGTDGVSTTEETAGASV